MYDIKKTGEIIRELRKQRGKTQEFVAGEMGINIKTYRAIETGVRGGSVDTLCLIAEYFSCSVDYLIYGMRCDHEMETIINQLDAEQKTRVLKIFQDIIVTIVTK